MAEFTYGHRGTGPSRYVRHDVYCSCHFCRNRRAIAPERPKGGSGKRLRPSIDVKEYDEKYVDTDVSGTFESVDKAPIAFSGPVGPASGTAQYQRVRSKVLLKYLWIRGYVHYNSQVAGTYMPGVLRFLVVYDKQPNGTQQYYTDVIASVDVSGTVTNTITSPANVDNLERFEILVDEQIYTGSGFGPATAVCDTVDKTKYSMDRVIVLEGRSSQFLDLTGSNFASGQIIYCFACAGDGAVTPNSISWIGTTRLCFEDS